MRILKILFLTILAASNHVVFAQKISGIASHIYDGDTFRLKKSNGDLVQIRLANIDAPELEQTHGIASREYLQKMLKGNEVVVDIQDIDKYGRTVGIVFSNNININDASVANGHAWHYWRYSKNINICKIENMAKRNKIGLWADPNPTVLENLHKSEHLLFHSCFIEIAEHNAQLGLPLHKQSRWNSPPCFSDLNLHLNLYRYCSHNARNGICVHLV